MPLVGADFGSVTRGSSTRLRLEGCGRGNGFNNGSGAPPSTFAPSSTTLTLSVTRASCAFGVLGTLDALDALDALAALGAASSCAPACRLAAQRPTQASPNTRRDRSRSTFATVYWPARKNGALSPRAL